MKKAHCPSCQKSIEKKANYCKYCGTDLSGPAALINDLLSAENLPLKKSKTNRFALVLAILQVALILFITIYQIFNLGIWGGMFNDNDVVFGNLGVFVSIHSTYVTVKSVGQFVSGALLVIAGIPMAIKLYFAKKRHRIRGKDLTSLLIISFLNAVFLTFALMLILYTYYGFSRILSMILLLASAILYLLVLNKCCRKIGKIAIIFQLLAFFAGLWFAWLITPFFGELLSAFGDTAMFILCILLGGGSSGSTIYVTVHVKNI